ncbi:hypothetical protein [Streptococcus merionis]|uniref:hypothetical protein n=1 Tax=Streptococcus merionis TaxID=400065 RepID=UPI003511295A
MNGKDYFRKMAEKEMRMHRKAMQRRRINEMKKDVHVPPRINQDDPEYLKHSESIIIIKK